MCRFLMVGSAAPVNPLLFLESFAALAERSPAPDGDPQADGWGISWLGESGQWDTRKYTDPVWESVPLFNRFPQTRSFCLHARSASSPRHKDNVEFNQPFVDGRYAFVFNGFLEGITLPYSVPGRIGSQKIWELVRARLAEAGSRRSLTEVHELLNRRSRRVHALNMGLTDGRRLYGLSQFDGHEDYYRCRVHKSAGLKMICSGPLEGFEFEPAPVGRVFSL